MINHECVGEQHRRFFMKNIQENLFMFKMITNFAAQFVNAWTSNTHK